uniref:CBFD_NFYB_HMF domain-containing protein n=1 Tax=Rhabditophanes sp. KR3021 TaxID=114890 RepID=A0AC35TFV8_9BILA
MAEQFQDTMPISQIVNIMKRKAPKAANFSKEFKGAMAKSAQLFIYYLTATAQEHAQKHKRKKIFMEDIIFAAKSLELESLNLEIANIIERMSWAAEDRGNGAQIDAENGSDVDESSNNVDVPTEDGSQVIESSTEPVEGQESTAADQQAIEDDVADEQATENNCNQLMEDDVAESPELMEYLDEIESLPSSN